MVVQSAQGDADYSGSMNRNVGPWWALLICVVGGLGIVMVLSVAMIELTGFGEM
jgi:hypothetical protein